MIAHGSRQNISIRRPRLVLDDRFHVVAQIAKPMDARHRHVFVREKLHYAGLEASGNRWSSLTTSMV
jgi:hypothetical protein